MTFCCVTPKVGINRKRTSGRLLTTLKVSDSIVLWRGTRANETAGRGQSVDKQEWRWMYGVRQFLPFLFPSQHKHVSAVISTREAPDHDNWAVTS